MKDEQALIYVLFGQDDFSLQESLTEIKKGLGEQELLAINTTVLDGQQLTLNQLKGTCDTMPFLAQKRLVIVEGLLGRFEPKARGGARQRNSTPKLARLDGPRALSAYIKEMPASTVLVLTDGRIRNSNPLLAELSPVATVKTFPMLKDAGLRDWIRRRVADGGGSISPQAVRLLTELIGGNLWVMATEIEKLLTYASGRRIEERDIDLVVGYAKEASIFILVDAILDRRIASAQQLLHQLLDEGAASPYILAMIVRQIRLIVRAKELNRQKVTLGEIQNRLGLTSQHALRRILDQAKGYPMEQLEEAYRKLLQTDLSIKTGRYQGELALTLLITELCQG